MRNDLIALQQASSDLSCQDASSNSSSSSYPRSMKRKFLATFVICATLSSRHKLESNHSWCRSPKETMVRCWTTPPGLSIVALLAFKFWKTQWWVAVYINLLISKWCWGRKPKKNTVKLLAVAKSTNSNCLHCSTRHLRSNYGHKDTETPASLMSSWGT